MTGWELRKARLRLGWTQVKLARVIRKHVNTVSNWERNVHPIEHAEETTLREIFRRERERQQVFGRGRRS